MIDKVKFMELLQKYNNACSNTFDPDRFSKEEIEEESKVYASNVDKAEKDLIRFVFGEENE